MEFFKLSEINYLAVKQKDVKEIALQIEIIVYDLVKHSFELQLMCVPGQAGILGNEAADKMARWDTSKGEII